MYCGVGWVNPQGLFVFPNGIVQLALLKIGRAYVDTHC